MNARLLVTTAILAILSGSGSHVLAQLPAAPTGSTPLEIARADFSAKVLSASRQLNEQYVRALTKLEALQSAGHDINELLDRSTINGWLDIYEPKEQKHGTTNRTTNQRGNQNGFAAALRYVADGRADEPF
jgi:hypothetical protein